MPMRPKKPCNQPGCPEVVEAGRRYCPAHAAQRRKKWDCKKERPHYHSLYHSVAWRRLREKHISDNPRCYVCGAAAEIVHHINPHRGFPDLFFNPDNLASICWSCHSRETLTAMNKKRWSRRGRGDEISTDQRIKHNAASHAHTAAGKPPRGK